MTLRKKMKYNAKRCLYTNGGKAVAIVLLSTAIYLLFSIIELLIAMLMGIVPQGQADQMLFLPGRDLGVSMMSLGLTATITLGTFLIIIPLNLGISSWYWKLSDNISGDIMAIFQCFSNRKMFFRALGLNISIVWRGLLWAALLFSVPAAVLLYCSLWAPRSMVTALGIVFGSILLLAAAAAFVLVMERYFVARYYLLDGETTVRTAIQKSVYATKGECEELFLFQLSFLGWFLSGLLVIPWIYAKPYYDMSSVLYARFLMEKEVRRTQLVPYQPQESTTENKTGEESKNAEEEDPFATKTFRPQNGR